MSEIIQSFFDRIGTPSTAPVLYGASGCGGNPGGDYDYCESEEQTTLGQIVEQVVESHTRYCGLEDCIQWLETATVDDVIEVWIDMNSNHSRGVFDIRVLAAA